jgi:hypothetical protein
MIKNHPMLCKEVDYDDGTRKCHGTITGVKYGGLMTDRKTWRIVGKSIRIRIKPDGGGRSFWTSGMRDVDRREPGVES